jgi:membrane-associated phospholipid phosphatase
VGASNPSEALSSLGWQEQARALVGANSFTAYAAARVYAVLSIAQYLAVVAADGHTDFEVSLSEDGRGLRGRRLLEARRGAVAGASAQVLAYFFPAAAASLEARVLREAEMGPGGVQPQFRRGLAIGRIAGDALVERAKHDGFTTPWTGTVPVGEGLWVANGTPAGAMLVGVTPYMLRSRDQFRPPPPPAFGSVAFVAARDEVRHISDTRTPEQLASAVYWNFPAGTFTPPGYWNLAAATYVQTYSLDERAATHVLALMHATITDAQIACWDAKFTYWMLRPSQADPKITLTFALPNHPSYPSGHSCLSAAAATVLSHFFPERTTELTNVVTEMGLSRIYAGIHYRFDVTTGRDLGVEVGNWALRVDRRTGLLTAISR